MIRRDGQLIQVRGNTTLRAGDVILALSDSETGLARLFQQPP